MDLGGSCSFRDGRVCFPSGAIDPNSCQVADFRKIVGNAPAAVSGEFANQIFFPVELGKLRLFLNPHEEPTEKSPVLMFWLELARAVSLVDLLRQFKGQPKFIYEEIEDEFGEIEKIFTVMFDPNFGAQFDFVSKQVKTFIFIRLPHLLECPCATCTLIRQEFDLPVTAGHS